MKGLRKEWEDIFAAAAFAEAGEHDKAIEILRSNRTVLLAISDSMFDRSSLKYALNVSKRINASLEILYIAKSEKEKVGFNDFLSEVNNEGFTFSLVIKEGCVKKAILDYTKKRRDILFVIVGSTSELEIECKTGENALTDTWKKMKCPLVIVSKGEILSMA